MATPVDPLCSTYKHTEGLRQFLEDRCGTARGLRVLDAGCGSASRVRLGIDPIVTGIDISARQLANHSGLSERILGDLQTYPLAAERFDVAVCWELLEHLANPSAALTNLARTLRPGGLLVIAVPNRWSVKGLVTRLTPARFHVLAYRHLFGTRHTGHGDEGPFPTHYHRSIAPNALVTLGATLGLSLVYREVYESGMQIRLRQSLHIPAWIWRLAIRTVRAASRGRVTLVDTECLLVLEKTVPPRCADTRYLGGSDAANSVAGITPVTYAGT